MTDNQAFAVVLLSLVKPAWGAANRELVYTATRHIETVAATAPKPDWTRK